MIHWLTFLSLFYPLCLPIYSAEHHMDMELIEHPIAIHRAPENQHIAIANAGLACYAAGFTVRILADWGANYGLRLSPLSTAGTLASVTGILLITYGAGLSIVDHCYHKIEDF